MSSKYKTGDYPILKKYYIIVLGDGNGLNQSKFGVILCGLYKLSEINIYANKLKEFLKKIRNRVNTAESNILTNIANVI